MYSTIEKQLASFDLRDILGPKIKIIANFSVAEVYAIFL